jgi:hypothetical protein
MVVAERVAARQLRWRPLAAVLVVVAFLAGGWLWISSWLGNEEAVRAGQVLSIGPDRQASVTVAGDGWQLKKSDSNPDQVYALTRAGLDLAVTYVPLASADDTDQLWSGLREVVAALGGSAGAAEPVRTTGGQAGQAGPVALDGKTGTAYVFPAPDRKFAIEFQSLAPAGGSDADRRAAEQTVLSLTFHPDQP